jgi:GrpB-like predicted nucleotidyltransferase (UPF0157 family)
VTIAVVPYSTEWARRFAAERALLVPALAPWLVDDVHHIGSTAVPGLAAKPIIDMMAGVGDLDAGAVAALAGLGYGHAPHRPDALWFHKPVAGPGYERTHHLHLTVPGSPLWRERLTFRDALRADAALRDEYAALKLRLATAHGTDLSGYTADKRDFVARVLGTHGITLTRRSVT